MNPEGLDVAYPVRPGDRNEELRYSLRSITANLPHLDVTLAGHVPPWVDGTATVGIRIAQTDHAKTLNALRNLHAILDCAFLTDEIVLMNDDFYVVDPVTDIPLITPGPLAWQIDKRAARSERYRRAQIDTITILEQLGRPNPWSFEGHRPIIVNRHELNETLATIRTTVPSSWAPERAASILWRTVHGALRWANRTGTVRAADVKVDHLAPIIDARIPTPFVSTNDSTFARGYIGKWIRARFTEPSRYEHTGPGSGAEPWADG
jgi:hypothetical protein